jgi:hypothetical protein
MRAAFYFLLAFGFFLFPIICGVIGVAFIDNGTVLVLLIAAVIMVMILCYFGLRAIAGSINSKGSDYFFSAGQGCTIFKRPS